MEQAIPSMIVGMLLLIASALTAHNSLNMYDDLSQSLTVMEVRLGEQSRTRTTVVSATLDPNKHTLIVNLRNDGQTRLAAFSQFDVIADYVTGAGAASAWLPYVAGAPTAGSWSVMSILGDGFEPGLLNPGETAVLRIELSPDASTGQTNRITIVSETGVAASASFGS